MARRRRPLEESPVRLTKQQRIYQRALLQLGRRVRELRYLRGWSYADLSDASGIHMRQLMRLEVHPETANPTFATLILLAEAFGVNLPELLSPPQSGVRRKRAPDEATDVGKVTAAGKAAAARKAAVRKAVRKASARGEDAAVVALSTKRSPSKKAPSPRKKASSR